MKTSLLVLLIVLAALGLRIRAEILADYEYNRDIGSYWSLGVKASTLALKADYLNRFVAAVDSAHLSGNNALFLKTPDNDVATNIATLKNLRQRMDEIRGMDVTSFAYQQALAQITAQEQDEAGRMLDVIEGRWYLTHHSHLWGWISALIYLGLVVAAFNCLRVFAEDSW